MAVFQKKKKKNLAPSSLECMATACGGTTRMSWISRAWKPPCRGEVAAGGTAAGAPSLLSHQAHRGASSTRNGGGETSGDGGPRWSVHYPLHGLTPPYLLSVCSPLILPPMVPRPLPHSHGALLSALPRRPSSTPLLQPYNTNRLLCALNLFSLKFMVSCTGCTICFFSAQM